MRQAAVTGVAWAAAAVVVIALVGTGVVFRDGVVRAWPPTASFYAAIGLPVNPTGLVIEQVRAEPSLQEGHATLAISGVIRNVVDHAVVAPPLRISLVNAQGKRVAGQITALENARIPPGETRHFVTSIFDPPYSAANLQIDFFWQDARTGAPVRPVRGPAAAIPASPGFTLRGAAADAAPVNAALAPATNAAPVAGPTSAPAAANAAPAGR
jgi:hypothetical protein